MLPDIGLLGYARSGKDTVADILVREYGYKRVAFADPLRDAALKLDPIVSYGHAPGDHTEGPGVIRLTELVASREWEGAKRDYPEVRRILQHIGQGIRDLDEDFWLNVAGDKIAAAHRQARPVVVTDVRYPNEFNTLQSEGFRMVRISRPDTGPANGHTSESALDGFYADAELRNDGSIAGLREAVVFTVRGI